jgi:hypothetical protein
MVTSALVRAPQLQNAEILVQFSRQRIEVNSALCKRTSGKDLKSSDNLHQCSVNTFSN